MSIPTSLIVVLLVVAWLVVLVPMVARRREKVPQSEAESGGSGFRVLRRASASLRRRPVRRPKGQYRGQLRPASTSEAPAQTTTTHGFAGGNVIDAPTETLVAVGADQQPHDAAEEWAAAHAGPHSGRSTGSHPAFPTAPEAESVAAPIAAPSDGQWPTAEQPDNGGEPLADHSDRIFAGSSPYQPQSEPAWQTDGAAPAIRFAPDLPQQPMVTDDTDAAPADRAEADRIPDEVDEQEWSDHAAAAPPSASYSEVDDEQLRPVPHRRGRGGFDPEAAEVTRAYKYQQRRRVTLILFLATAVFTVAAVFLVSWLWVGAVVSLALLVGYLAYLRRQVRIEASIRQRRMERLQRARQIRPESGRSPRRARTGTSAVVPGRTVVDLDDDDPAFDDLDEYQQPVTYRRAAGQ